MIPHEVTGDADGVVGDFFQPYLIHGTFLWAKFYAHNFIFVVQCALLGVMSENKMNRYIKYCMYVKYVKDCDNYKYDNYICDIYQQSTSDNHFIKRNTQLLINNFFSIEIYNLEKLFTKL